MKGFPYLIGIPSGTSCARPALWESSDPNLAAQGSPSFCLGKVGNFLYYQLNTNDLCKALKTKAYLIFASKIGNLKGVTMSTLSCLFSAVATPFCCSNIMPPAAVRRGFPWFRRHSSKAEETFLKIRKSIQESQIDGPSPFLPAGKINQIASQNNVRDFLMSCGAMESQLVQYVCRNAQRIFLALVVHGYVSPGDTVKVLKQCADFGLKDIHLPVEKLQCFLNGAVCEPHAKELNLFHQPIWNEAMFRFHQDQFVFLSPVFTRTKFTYILHAKCPLPFLTEERRTVKDGNFSTVSETTVHPDHFEGHLNNTTMPGGNEGGIKVALKKLKELTSEPGYKVEDAWAREVSALEELGVTRTCHDHLVLPFAAIKRDREHYIMFEWADGGSLRDIWVKQGVDPRDLTADRVRCVLEELKGISGALSFLHKNTENGGRGADVAAGDVSRDLHGHDPDRSSWSASQVPEMRLLNAQNVQSPMQSVPDIQVSGESSWEDIYSSEETEPETEAHWRHGDLKPDNILAFRPEDSGRWLGTLKIADMGLAKQHMFKTSKRMERTGQKYTTIRYEAPEAMPNFQDPRSRRYDIWSMGCVILEFIILLLHGNRGLNEFYNERTEQERSMDTLYFTIIDRATGAAQVSKTVEHWIEGILSDPECNRGSGSALRDLTMLVKDRLLVVRLPDEKNMTTDEIKACRADAKELEASLEDILEKGRIDQGKGGTYLAGNWNRSGIPIPHTRDVRRVRSSHPSSQHLSPDHARIPFSSTVSPTKSNSNPEAPDQQSERRTLTYFSQYTTNSPLDTNWNLHIDNRFTIRFLRTTRGQVQPRRSRCSIGRFCKDCRAIGKELRSARLDSPFQFEQGLRGMKEKGWDHAVCGMMRMVYGACCTKLEDKSEAIKIHRDGSNLFLSGYPSPLLSLCIWPGVAGKGDCLTSSCSLDNIAVDGDGVFQIASPKLLSRKKGSALFTLLTSWLTECDQHHTCCSRYQASCPPQPLPTRLLDVGQSSREHQRYPWEEKVRLCETADMIADQSCSAPHYIALSHPWGDGSKHNHFCTTTKNIAARTAHGIWISELPKTLQDAVQVTRELGIRYIWIDTLCIIQGDDGDFDSEARRMELVYSMAYCVIAASCATGTSSGFLKRRPHREYAVIPTETNKYKGRSSPILYLCDAIDDFQRDVLESDLNKRGWVLQERALARRTIFFTEKQVYFECGDGVRCETMTKMTNHQAAFLGDPSFPSVAMRSTRGFKILLCQSLYKTYSALQFSKAYDRSIAIAGLEQRLIRAFRTQGGYGVFDSPFFGRSLLWKRDERATPAMKPIIFPADKKYYGVPTWSWMAYEGIITFMDLPFSGVEWRYVKEGVIPPWGTESEENESGLHSYAGMTMATITTISSTDSRGWHTGRTDWSDIRGAVMKAKARDITVSLNKVHAEKRIIYDAGQDPSQADSQSRRIKCVIIGREIVQPSSEENTSVVSDDARENYVLVVAERDGSQGSSGGRPPDYVRIGVGTLPGDWIHQDGLTISII
ncbi:Heterokaryon incompatibility protein (HET) domain containing protein [Rhypophila decipiens]